MWKKPWLLSIACLTSVWSLPTTVSATTISIGSASTLVGSEMCQLGFGGAQCKYRSFDTTGDLAWSGGSAAPAVVSSTISGNGTGTPPTGGGDFSLIHNALFVNDGNYGNGRSWIGVGANQWLKIDLGLVRTIDRITFGRDRLTGVFDDRDPGRFWIDTALSDAVYANGDAANDGTEYINVVDSVAAWNISSPQTVVVDFDTGPITARYIKMTFNWSGAAIDEVEVFGAAVPEPTTIALLILGLAGIGFSRRKAA